VLEAVGRHKNVAIPLTSSARLFADCRRVHYTSCARHLVERDIARRQNAPIPNGGEFSRVAFAVVQSRQFPIISIFRRVCAIHCGRCTTQGCLNVPDANS
jgi:hypothetical protein